MKKSNKVYSIEGLFYGMLYLQLIETNVLKILRIVYIKNNLYDGDYCMQMFYLFY